MSVVTTAFSLGIGLGPLLAGVLATVRFELPFWTIGALCLVGAGIVHRFMREPQPPETHKQPI
jgi:MFS family permease